MTSSGTSAFEALPQRLYLDSCTVQTLRDYGASIFEGEPIDPRDKINSIPHGIEHVEALRRIFEINERALFEWIVGPGSVAEARDKNDPGHLRWVYDVLDHTEVCLTESGGPTQASRERAALAGSPKFGYLSEKDKKLIQEAVYFDCDAFLTVEQRLPKNGPHLQRELGLRVFRPTDFWAVLEPWAGL